MGLIENFKRDIARHRGRSTLLGVLFVAMVLFSVRAFLQLNAKPALASIGAAFQPEPTNPVSRADSQLRMKESQELWEKLREKKSNAADSAVAFRFDAAFYPVPILPEGPKKPTILTDPDPVRMAPPVPTVDPRAMRAGRFISRPRG